MGVELLEGDSAGLGREVLGVDNAHSDNQRALEEEAPGHYRLGTRTAHRRLGVLHSLLPIHNPYQCQTNT